jgi:pyruvate kinase
MSSAEEIAQTRRTKLVCTIGPASAKRIEALAIAGMDVARINFSHGTAASHAAAANAVRRAAASTHRSLAILTDLAGPKIRLGELAGGSMELEAGRPFVLRVSRSDAAPGDASGAQVTSREIPADIRIGDRIFLADGAAELRVTGLDAGIRTEVIRGGTIRSRAGVAIPAARLASPALTAKDRRDIPRAIEMGASYIGQSFVRSADDVRQLRRELGADGPRIIAKIETRPAVESFDDILDVADGVMIARGDLGVEMPYEQVPLIQKQLVGRALDRGLPSIVATQMLESMTAAPLPTRAEASDVANAVFDGADAIMLSAETAIGAYPLHAAEAATRIASFCEAQGGAFLPSGRSQPPGTDADALAFAAVALTTAHQDVKAICCYTRTGRTARVLSSLRPWVPIVAFAPDAEVVARLALANAVIPRHSASLGASDQIRQLLRVLGESRLVPEGTPVVLVSSTAKVGSAPNLLGIYRVATA